MRVRRPLTTGEVLGLLAASLVLLLLLPLRTAGTFTTLAVVLAASITTLGVAVSLLTYHERSLDVVDGFVVAVAATLLTLPTAVSLVAMAAVPTTGVAALAPETLSGAVPEATRLVGQWVIPAVLAFPLGLARTDRARVAVGTTFLVAFAVASAVAPPSTLADFGGLVVRFVGAAFLGGPLFVAARAFPRRPDRSPAGVR
ncbi:hypothetical protein [Salinigranum salinum]|uniref:hypothetical protein n=1 Tax=Salinigranum salinum TaxID=1364937 RepID=UPI0018641CAB|nr:hypothetical protein [Salinigranum salinum]